jgi:hypothetical protein
MLFRHISVSADGLEKRGSICETAALPTLNNLAY